jgi:hypothetical protein
VWAPFKTLYDQEYRAKQHRRLEEAVRQAVIHAKKLVTALLRSAERIRELRIKKRREKARSQRRQENRRAEMAIV